VTAFAGRALHSSAQQTSGSPALDNSRPSLAVITTVFVVPITRGVAGLAYVTAVFPAVLTLLVAVTVVPLNWSVRLSAALGSNTEGPESAMLM